MKLCSPDRPLRAAAYCRVSTDKEDQLNSLETQRQFFENYIQSKDNLTLAGVFADEGLSGTSIAHRPQFLTMLHLAEEGQLDLILTKEVSRFARNTVDTLAVTRRLKALGVGVLFLNDGIDTRQEDGEFRLTIMASVAQEESRKISQRTRWGQAQAMKRGVVFGNDSLLGYRLSGGQLTVDPQQAEVVRSIFHQFLVERKGSHVIARALTQAGTPPPLGPGGCWSSAEVLRILRNEKYTGDLLQQKYITTDHLTHRKIPNDGSQPQLLLRDHHEAIIDRKTFQAVQEELARRRELTGTGKRFTSRYWYSGKVVCGLCGRTFTVKTTRRKSGKVYRRFVCRGTLAAGRGAPLCTAKGISAAGVELAARHVLSLLALNRDGMIQEILTALQALRAAQEAPGRNTHQLHQAIARQQARRERALEAFLDGAITRADWQRQSQRCQEEIQRLQDQLDRQAKPASADDGWQKIRTLLEEEVAGGPCVLEEVIERIEVFPEHVNVFVTELPVFFRLRLNTEGSGRSYTIQVAECTPLPREAMRKKVESSK